MLDALFDKIIAAGFTGITLPIPETDYYSGEPGQGWHGKLATMIVERIVDKVQLKKPNLKVHLEPGYGNWDNLEGVSSTANALTQIVDILELILPTEATIGGDSDLVGLFSVSPVLPGANLDYGTDIYNWETFFSYYWDWAYDFEWEEFMDLVDEDVVAYDNSWYFDGANNAGRFKNGGLFSDLGYYSDEWTCYFPLA